jgi:cell division protein FtsB
MEKRSILDQSTLIPIGLAASIIITVVSAVWFASSINERVSQSEKEIANAQSTLTVLQAENTALNVRLIRIEENTNRLLKIFENYEIRINP